MSLAGLAYRQNGKVHWRHQSERERWLGRREAR